MAGIQNKILYSEGNKITPTSAPSMVDLQQTATEVSAFNYTGDPEGVISANPSSLCHDPVSGFVYKKDSGVGNTGWSLLGTPTSIGVQAYINANQPNITGDGTTGPIIWDANSWEVGGSNMDNTTGVFTIPVGGAGKYLISYGLTLNGLDAAHTFAQFNIETSLGTATKKLFNPGVARTSDNYYQATDFTIIDGSEGQTIVLSGGVGNGAKTVGLQGVFNGLYGYFEIYKLSN